MTRGKQKSKKTESASKSGQRAQVLWSLIVACAVAVVALGQAVSAHREPDRSTASTSTFSSPLPQALITGQPLPSP
ncbi:MAG: hypothetical protein P4M08_02950 [Oligoflexia bacterium]|nr:hypothetical protein [Oligoflexia bacterium]